MRNLKTGYQYDSRQRLWKRQDAKAFAYSDGAEKYLLDALKNVSDKSVFSSELTPLLRDWASTYHLSSARANLLRPFAGNLLSGASVLELGCGCGGVTRFLGETADEVLAVEGSSSRGMVAAERCADLDNVTVVVDRIQDLPQEIGRFDVVTLIGVLEYAAKFDLTPVGLLGIARRFLKEDGALILALENRLGLKYLAGVPEDHLCTSWSGVTGAYRQNGVTTWSRRELRQLLREAGFETHEQFVPVPDYKLPTTVITEAGLDSDCAGFNPAPLLAGRQRPFEKAPLFNLPAAWESVVQAGLLPELADSLCFVARPHAGQQANKEAILAEHYGNPVHQKRQFAKITSFVKNGSEIQVRRKKFFDIGGRASPVYEQIIEDEPYFPGERVCDLARRVVTRIGWTTLELAESLRPWVDFIISKTSRDGLISGSFLDLTPFNLIVDGEGIAHPFDLEWHRSGSLPASFLLARGIVNMLPALVPVSVPAPNTAIDFGSILKGIFTHFSLEFDETQMAAFWDGDSLEKALNLPLLSWQETLQRSLAVNVHNFTPFFQLAGQCQAMGLPPERVPEYITAMQKHMATMQSQMKVMQRMIEHLQKKQGVEQGASERKQS